MRWFFDYLFPVHTRTKGTKTLQRQVQMTYLCNYLDKLIILYLRFFTYQKKISRPKIKWLSFLNYFVSLYWHELPLANPTMTSTIFNPWKGNAECYVGPNLFFYSLWTDLRCFSSLKGTRVSDPHWLTEDPDPVPNWVSMTKNCNTFLALIFPNFNLLIPRFSEKMCKCEILIYLILMIFMSRNISSYYPKET